MLSKNKSSLNSIEYTDHQVDQLKNKLYHLLKKDRSTNRQYVDSEINKLFAEISCDPKNSCCCSSGPPGRPGRPGTNGTNGTNGAKGDKGEQGLPGSNIVPVNNTVFVDAQFGTAAGTREDLSKPFQTLLQGLSAAAPNGDTVYVQPGVYNESNLLLAEGVNWYFTEGAIVNSTDGYIFTDNNVPVSVIIDGYGQFISSGGVLNISRASDITLQGISAELSGSNPGFLFSTVDGSSEITVDIVEINSTSPTVIQIDGNTRINWRSQTINSTSSIIVINDPATGTGNFTVQNIIGGDPDILSLTGGLFYNNSEFFNMTLLANMIISNSNQAAINVSVAAIVGDGSTTSITTVMFIASGGILNVEGPLGTFQLNQPKVELNAGILRINATTSTIQPVIINRGIVDIKIPILVHSGDISHFVYNVLNDSVVTITSNIVVTLTSSLLNVMTVLDQFGITKLFSHIVFIPSGELLRNIGNSSVTIDSNDIILTGLPTGSSAVTTTGRTSIDADQLIISTVGVVGPYIPLINHLDGEFVIDISNYSFDGIFVYSILTTAGISTINIINANSGSSDNIFFQTSGNSCVVSENINMFNHAIIIEDNGFLRCRISNINVFGPGNALDIRTNAGCDGFISTIRTNTGSIIISTTTGNTSLVFNEFNINGSIPLAGTGFDLIGTGDVKLVGNVVNTNNADVGFKVSNGCQLGLRLTNLYCNQNRILFDITADAGGMYLDFMQIAVNDINVLTSNFFNITGGTVTMKGGDINVTNNANTAVPLFNVFDNASLTCIAQNIQCPAGLLLGKTKNNVVITFNTLNAGNINLSNVAIIDIAQGNYQIRGDSAFITVIPTGNLIESFVNANNEATGMISVDDVQSQVTIVSLTTNNNFWYETKMSVVNGVGNLPAVYINSNTENVVYTLAGLFSTEGKSAILFDALSANNRTRVISATLISQSVSINDPNAGTRMITVVPSIANQMVSGVTIVPAGTLFVDPLVS